MATKKQQRQRAEREARLSDRIAYRRLLKDGWVKWTTIPIPPTDATEVDFYHDEKRISRALLQADGSFAGGGRCFDLVPAGTEARPVIRCVAPS